MKQLIFVVLMLLTLTTFAEELLNTSKGRWVIYNYPTWDLKSLVDSQGTVIPSKLEVGKYFYDKNGDLFTIASQNGKIIYKNGYEFFSSNDTIVEIQKFGKTIIFHTYNYKRELAVHILNDKNDRNLNNELGLSYSSASVGQENILVTDFFGKIFKIDHNMVVKEISIPDVASVLSAFQKDGEFFIYCSMSSGEFGFVYRIDENDSVSVMTKATGLYNINTINNSKIYAFEANFANINGVEVIQSNNKLISFDLLTKQVSVIDHKNFTGIKSMDNKLWMFNLSSYAYFEEGNFSKDSIVIEKTDTVVIQPKDTTTSGISKIETKLFQVFPNPTIDFINVGKEYAFIFSLSGQLVAEGKNLVDVRDLPNSVYAIKNELGEISRFIKQ